MSHTVTLQELTDLLAEKENISKASAKEFILSWRDSMVSYLKQGHRIELRQFGCFEVINVPQRERRNPKTGEKITLEASRSIKFFPSNEQVKLLNKE